MTTIETIPSGWPALHESYWQVETHKEFLDTQGILRFGIVKIAAHESYQQVK